MCDERKSIEKEPRLGDLNLFYEPIRSFIWGGVMDHTRAARRLRSKFENRLLVQIP
jgi:hypothetical protein